jgi:hypothetical protein
MPSTELEYLCTGLECLLQIWNAFDSVGIPWYRVGMLSPVLECFRQGWNAFYRVRMLSTGKECFRRIWNTFVQSWNTF